jgi:hypothetical protein
LHQLSAGSLKANESSSKFSNEFGLMEGTGVKTKQKVVLTHNSVKNNECDVTYVLIEPRRHSKCIIHKAWCFKTFSLASFSLYGWQSVFHL